MKYLFITILALFVVGCSESYEPFQTERITVIDSLCTAGSHFGYPMDSVVWQAPTFIYNDLEDLQKTVVTINQKGSVHTICVACKEIVDIPLEQPTNTSTLEFGQRVFFNESTQQWEAN